MKISHDQISEDSLIRFGEEATNYFRGFDYQGLVNAFGYALTFEREPAAAVEEDLKYCFSAKGLSQVRWDSGPASFTVKYFEPNSAALFALVECSVPVKTGGSILVELIVTLSGADKHITLEGISNVI